MKGLDIIVSKKKIEDLKSDMLVFFACLDKKEKIQKDSAATRLGVAALDVSEFEGKKEQSLLLYPPFENKKLQTTKRVLLVGLGKIDEKNNTDQLLEGYRVAGGAIAQVCKKIKAKSLGIQLPNIGNIAESEFSESLVEGITLGLYQFKKYKTNEENGYQGLRKIAVLGADKEHLVRKGVERGSRSAAAGCVARDMANEPGNGWTPTHFAKYGKKLAKLKNVQCSVMEKAEMEKLEMGGILAVNKGSHEEPKLVVLDYTPEKYSATVMLVGKGLTFDSGGVSLKPPAGMMDMKYDMCGGAAVIAAFEAVAKEKLQTRVLCLVPSTDNMSGGGAVKPGDIITHYGGATSEIENTDAEGRLILADAIAYGLDKFKPDCVIDLATLTGAVIIALGHHNSGVMSNSDALVKRIIEAGGRAGEPLWRLPLGDSYAKQLKSKVADLKNTGGRPAGSITAAEYLHKFVGDTPWAHLDIAGTAWEFTEKTYVPKGPSGIGARTLVELIRNCKSLNL